MTDKLVTHDVLSSFYVSLSLCRATGNGNSQKSTVNEIPHGNSLDFEDFPLLIVYLDSDSSALVTTYLISNLVFNEQGEQH